MKDFTNQERAVDAYRNSRKRAMVFLSPGRPNAGVQNNDFRFLWPGKVVECYANVRNTPSEQPLIITVERCSQENIDTGGDEWHPVLSTPMTIDVGKKSTTASAIPNVIGNANVDANDHFRVTIAQTDLNVIDLEVQVVVLLK